MAQQDKAPGKTSVTLCMISGTGRSGSNRLLDMLDFCDMTSCRNEPDAIEGGWLKAFGYRFFDEGLTEADISQLRAHLMAAGHIRSTRDRFNRPDKLFLTPLGKRLLPLMARRKLRKLAHRVGLMGNPHEWRLPQAATRTAPMLPVMKLNSRPIWAERMAQAEPGLRIVHNIRQPSKYLNSWYNRFIAGQTTIDASFTAHFADVPQLLAYFGRDDSDRLKEGTLDNIVEVELWRWRYVNERLMALDTGEGRYLRVTYEAIDTDPLAAARQVYDFLDLEMTPDVEKGVLTLKNTLFAKAHKSSLDPDLARRLIEDVLGGSPVEQAFKDGLALP